MNKKKIITLCLVVCLVVTAVAGASLAYFTDTKSKTNTFTVGNVSIELIETDLHRENPNEGWLHNPDYPVGAQPDDTIKAAAREYKDLDVYPGFNVIKAPFVINTGSNAAYVRVHYMVPASLFSLIDAGPTYWTTSLVGKGEGGEKEEKATSEAIKYYFDHGNSMDGYTTTTVGDVEYYDFCFVYQDPIEAGKMTYWNCWGNIKIPETATAEDFGGIDSFNVIVTADAIQADGFATAAAAFEAFDKA